MLQLNDAKSSLEHPEVTVRVGFSLSLAFLLFHRLSVSWFPASAPKSFASNKGMILFCQFWKFNLTGRVRNVFFTLLSIYFFRIFCRVTHFAVFPGEFGFIRPGRASDVHHTWTPVPWRCSIWALIVCILLMIFFWWPTKEIPKLITSLKQKHNVHKSQQWSMKRLRGISLPRQKETEKRPY